MSSVKHGEKGKRSPSHSPSRRLSITNKSNTGSKSGKSHSKKSVTSAKSAVSIQSSLLSAKKSPADDNKPKKVVIRVAELEELNLRTEDLSFTGLTQVPNDVFSGKDIGELDISGNNLRSVPGDICNLTELRAFNISQNSLKCTSANDYSGLPKELALLKHLQVVAISECNLRYVPVVLFECLSIKRLNISRNKFQMLPPDIGNLVDLEYLNASETSVKSLPPEIAFCERLQEINLYGNILEMLPETMRELNELTELKINARSFHSNIDEYMNKLLRNGQIKSEHIPSVLFDIPELRTLDLDGTRINNLPEENSCKLEDLYLSNNYFVSVPKGLKTLPYLVMVDLSHNFIPNIPDSIVEYLPSIRVLRLNFNLLSSFAAGICNLISLEELEMCNNKITQVPAGIGNLTQLRIFRIANNRVSSLPNSLCGLTDLETLELTNNRIGELPLGLFKLEKLLTMHTYSHMKPVGLWLHKNPITEPPEVIWKGVDIEPLNVYLKKLQIRRTENMQPLKLIYLGQQGSGKTTLNRTLATGKCQMSEYEEEVSRDYLTAAERSGLMKRLPRDNLIEDLEEPNRRGSGSISTCVASIQQWQSENAIRICSFDLAGSEVYRITHQYFLDKNALYLLIYNHSVYDDSDDSYYRQIGCWLDMLQVQVPGAVVKLVGTHADQSPTGGDQTRARVLERVQKQLEDQKANLATELIRLKQKVSEAKGLVARGETTASTNMVEFDPNMNMLQMEYQIRQIESLLSMPVHLQTDISVVSCTAGLTGIARLMSDIELIAINKDLLPFCQRYIPASWHKFKMALKKKPDYQLSWLQVRSLADKYKLNKDVLVDCLEYIHNCGDIIWLNSHPNLKQTVFHKPLKLIEVLKGVIHHDIGSILDFDNNKSFSSVGKLSREQFEDCKYRFLQYGEFSRQLLLSMWYYVPDSRGEFEKSYKLLSDLELAYLIPQSDIPTSQTYKEPLLVIPWYVQADSHTEEVEMYWSQELEAGKREMEIVYNFTQEFPEGVFERLSAQLQGQAELRLDWADTIYIEVSDAQILAKRYVSATTNNIEVSIQVRSSELRLAMKYMAKLHQTWIGILSSIPGLVWNVANYTARKHAQLDKNSVLASVSTDSRPISQT